MQVDEMEGSSANNEFDLPLVHMSHDEFERADKYLESRLDELKQKLDALKGIDLTVSSATIRHHSSTTTASSTDDPYLSEFLAELERLELEAHANLSSVRFWFGKETAEIEDQFKNEYKR